MQYHIIDIEVTNPLPNISIPEQYKGIAFILRRKGKPIAFWMEPLSKSRVISSIDLAKNISGKGRDKLIAEAIREELINIQKPSRMPSLTIAICTKDRTHKLGRCLNSVRLLKPFVYGMPVFMDVIVVDNAPSDELTKELIDMLPNVRYICERKPGLNFARNRALQEAKGELLAFLDDDVTVDQFWLDGLMEAWAENPKAGAFTGLVLPYELSTKAQILFEKRGGWRKSFDRIIYGHSFPGDYLYPCGAGRFGTGANMAFKRDVLINIGSFDEALDTGSPLPGGGDLDIFYRVIRSGYLLVYDPKYMVFHEHRRTVTALRQQYWSWGLSLMAFISKSYKTDPSQRIKLRKLTRLWFTSRLLYFMRYLRGNSYVISPDILVAELWGGVAGLLGEYSRSQKRIDKINNRFL